MSRAPRLRRRLCRAPQRRRGLWRALLLAATVAALLASSASAGAAPTLLTGSEDLAGSESLAFSGSATLIASLVRNAGVVTSFAPGSAPRVIAHVPPKTRAVEAMTLVASPSRIGLLESGVAELGYKGNSRDYVALESGLLGGALSAPPGECKLAPTVDEGETGSSGTVGSAIALEGEALAYDSNGCVIVEELASGAQHIIRLESTLAPLYEHSLSSFRGAALLRLAGQLVAYRDNALGDEDAPASIVVYDFATGKELYSVPIPPFAKAERPPTFALEADGTLLIANPQSCTATLSTIAQPTPAPLGVPACEVAGLKEGRALIVAPGEGGDRTLDWTPIEAAVMHPIADLGSKGLLEASAPVLEGGEVAYALGGCWVPSVYRTALAEPGTPPAPPSSCPAQVLHSRAILDRNDLRVQIRCPLGCHGKFAAYAGAASRLERGKHLEMLTNSLFSLPPGKTKTIVYSGGVRGRDAAARLLRRLRGGLKKGEHEDVKVAFSIDTPSAEGARSYPEGEGEEHKSESQSSEVVPVELAR